jgi:hypothetical protein
LRVQRAGCRYGRTSLHLHLGWSSPASPQRPPVRFGRTPGSAAKPAGGTKRLLGLTRVSPEAPSSVSLALRKGFEVPPSSSPCSRLCARDRAHRPALHACWSVLASSPACPFRPTRTSCGMPAGSPSPTATVSRAQEHPAHGSLHRALGRSLQESLALTAPENRSPAPEKSTTVSNVVRFPGRWRCPHSIKRAAIIGGARTRSCLWASEARQSSFKPRTCDHGGNTMP